VLENVLKMAIRHRTSQNLVLCRANGRAQKRTCPAATHLQTCLEEHEVYLAQPKFMMRKRYERQPAKDNWQVVRKMDVVYKISKVHSDKPDLVAKTSAAMTFPCKR